MTSFFIHLIQKIQLTHDVYELLYTTQEPLPILPGQFLLCETDENNTRLRRAYSVSDAEGINIYFIIKVLPEGKGGSKAICEQEIGHKMQVWGPIGGFILPIMEPKEHIIFVGTGTGFAPLYFQAKKILEKNPFQKISFIFGVREQKDLFYRPTFLDWMQRYPHFSGHFCLSKPESENSSEFFAGRVTDYLNGNPLYLSPNDTTYSICGSPAMVAEVRGMCKNAGIDDGKVFFEQY